MTLASKSLRFWDPKGLCWRWGDWFGSLESGYPKKRLHFSFKYLGASSTLGLFPSIGLQNGTKKDEVERMLLPHPCVRKKSPTQSLWGTHPRELWHSIGSFAHRFSHRPAGSSKSMQNQRNPQWSFLLGGERHACTLLVGSGWPDVRNTNVGQPRKI